MFGGFLNLSAECMLIQAENGLLIKELARDFSGLVLARIAEAIFKMILNNLGEVIKPGGLYPLKEVYGVNWEANKTDKLKRSY